MKKIQYGIVGFVVGIMTGLLFALAEVKLFKELLNPDMLPFMIGITVIASAVTGVSVAVRRAKRR